MGRACKAAPGSPQYAVEAGYQALLQGDVQGALAQYSRASHLHELDMEAMYGSIECDLLVGKVCGLHLIVFQADRPFLTVFHACVVSCSGCPFSAYMLQSKHSKLGALRKHAWTTKLLTRSLLPRQRQHARHELQQHAKTAACKSSSSRMQLQRQCRVSCL